MMNDKILVTYSSNWADEMDICTSQLMTVSNWKELCDNAKNVFSKTNTLTHYVGTNQYIEYESYKQWFSCYKVQELTEQEYTVLEKYQSYTNKRHFFEPEYYPEDYENKVSSY